VLHSCRPDLVLVQGDTTTSFSATLSAFYERIPVGHVEAGLRTADLSSPWPEEANRRMTGVLATFHFAPTECARRNLLLERVPAAHIVVTGNTVLDALLDVRARIACDRQLKRSFAKRFGSIDFRHKIILVTGHRRENLGQGLKSICRALIDLAAREDVEIVYPVHLNPNVRTPVHELLGGIPRIHLLEPLDYLAFVFLMSRCYLIISDSGGIQEEAPSLGKPVIVTRNTTERPEALEADAILLVGTERRTIVKAASRLLDDAAAYRSMARANNLFGDGRASEKIVSFLSSALGWSNETLSSGRSERVAQFVPTEPLAQDQAYEGGIGP
jgi:UDP-N-acetylglucosamine 2-epimerase (non-hydrolysing)